MESSQLLAQLEGAVQNHVLPHLEFADVQSLGQACRTTHAMVTSLPRAKPQQLAQVITFVSLPVVTGACTALTPAP